MMGTTAGTTGKNRYAFLERALKDAESANMNFPAQYMFKDVPFSDQARDADGNLDEPPQGPDLLLPFMDRCNVEIAMVGIAASGEGEGVRCVTQHPDRFIPCHEPDPNDGVEAIRTIRRPRRVRPQGGHGVPVGPDAAGADRRAADVPDLRPVL